MARQNAALPLLRMTRAIFSILLKADIRIKSSHIPGITNILEDRLSRLDQAGDYELKADVYQKCIRALQVLPAVDCFANVNNTKCARFFAPTHNQLARNAAAVDGLLQKWSTEKLPYLHPQSRRC
jgi:hypothetical protein